MFLLFDQVLATGGSEALARGVALNMLVAGEIVYLFNCRRWTSPSWTVEALNANPVAWLSVAVLVGLQLALTYWPPMQAVFELDGLQAGHWPTIGALCAVLFALVEIEKAIVARRTSRAARPAARGGRAAG